MSDGNPALVDELSGLQLHDDDADAYGDADCVAGDDGSSTWSGNVQSPHMQPDAHLGDGRGMLNSCTEGKDRTNRLPPEHQGVAHRRMVPRSAQSSHTNSSDGSYTTSSQRSSYCGGALSNNNQQARPSCAVNKVWEKMWVSRTKKMLCVQWSSPMVWI